MALGAKVHSAYRLFVEGHQETSVPGLFAAGDLVRGPNQISVANGEAAIAATAVHNRLRWVFAEAIKLQPAARSRPPGPRED